MSIHWMPCPHSVTRRFSSLISVSSYPFPQTPFQHRNPIPQKSQATWISKINTKTRENWLALADPYQKYYNPQRHSLSTPHLRYGHRLRTLFLSFKSWHVLPLVCIIPIFVFVLPFLFHASIDRVSRFEAATTRGSPSHHHPIIMNFDHCLDASWSFVGLFFSSVVVRDSRLKSPLKEQVNWQVLCAKNQLLDPASRAAIGPLGNHRAPEYASNWGPARVIYGFQMFLDFPSGDWHRECPRLDVTTGKEKGRTKKGKPEPPLPTQKRHAF